MRIKEVVQKTVRRYDTRNPFEIARQKQIRILYENLGAINGYYKTAYRQKQIHINQNRSKHMQQFVCAHELGHAILHSNSNTPFLRGNTFFLVDKLEIEANTFALELLISDEELAQYKNFNTEQIARIYGYHQKLIELRLKSLIREVQI